VGSSLRQEIVETLRPPAGSADGILPPLMVLLTLVTGIVDADAYLRLGHVFVANMTGKVVFLGFAAAGASGLSVAGSRLAVADLTTTVLTLTLTGLAADSRLGGGSGAHTGRRLLAVAAMLIGAVVCVASSRAA
jgi:uncharacterized membrane protein YoaK (UPF0700 family)